MKKMGIDLYIVRVPIHPHELGRGRLVFLKSDSFRIGNKMCSIVHLIA